MKMTRVSDQLSVSPQPGREDFAPLAADGVKLVINNRPDGEDPGQLNASQGAELAAKNGMAYRHIPVRLPDLGLAEIDAFTKALEGTNGLIHAHCRSGVRSITLWALSEVMTGRLAAPEVGPAIEALGFDPKPAVAWLAAHPDAAPQ